MKKIISAGLILGFLITASVSGAAANTPSVFHSTKCDGNYHNHLQGIGTDERAAIFWSWTDALVKTDADGHILKQIKVAIHHGDLCFRDGKIFVAVNLGKFNEPAGKADSWVYVYDAETLEEVARHPVPELVHGAGGIAWHDGKFIIVGGLPEGVEENYLYEYDADFAFQKRHALSSGYTKKGIQTVAFSDGSWWCGCYGSPQKLLRADAKFQLTVQWKFDAAVGIVGVGNGQFLIGRNTKNKDGSNSGRIVTAHADPKKGLVLE